jgi:hypothetical protein
MTIHEPSITGDRPSSDDVEQPLEFHKGFGFTSTDVEGAATSPIGSAAGLTPSAEPADPQPPSPTMRVSAIGIWELIMGSVSLVTWFVLFAGGILINTEPYRNRIGGGEGSASLLTSWLIVLLFWTITNVGILACVSAILGALGRRTRFTMQAAMDPDIDSLPEDTMGALVFYYSAVMRGFGIYALVFAGLFVLATEAFVKPQAGDYLRLAATMSIASFYAGYDPTVFAVMLLRAKRLFDATDRPK